MYHFEDLAVGDTFETRTYTITKDEMLEFARSFDPQPFHTDEAAAEESMFGELIASGLHTLCLSTRLFFEHFRDDGGRIASMGGSGMDELRWHRPVSPGDSLRVRIDVLDKETAADADRGIVDFRSRVLNGEDELVMSVVMHFFIGRRAAER